MGCPFSNLISNQPEDDISKNLPTYSIIHRLAIDQSADIGSLYNARVDRLLETSALDIPPTSNTPSQTTWCPVIDIGSLEGTSLTKMFNIDKELCLSIYLNMVQSKGISLLLEHMYTINKHTRFFSYYCRTKKTLFTGEPNAVKLKSIDNTAATHVVTEIQFGVHVIVILQLLPEYELKLDRLLEKMKNQLTTNTFRIESDEEDLFNQFTDTKVFSNIPDIETLTKLIEVCQKLNEIASDVTLHRPMEYTLQPIRSFFPSYPADRGNCYSLKEEYMNQIDAHLYQLLSVRNSLNVPMDWEVKKLLEKYLKQQQLQVEKSYQETKTRYNDLISNIRSGKVQQDTSNVQLINDLNKTLLEKTCETNNSLNALKAKAHLIKDLIVQGIEYLNVKEFVENDDECLETIEEKLLEKYQHERIFCFDDNLGQENSVQRNDLYTQLINESKNTSQSKCVYADFSYCSRHLLQMKIISSKDIQEQQKGLSTSTELNTNCLDETKSSTVNFINVLLLGESGVGKSTFINALANYLTFDTLEQARSGQPIVLMPVSFLITEGDDFKERILTFGDKDPNEDHNQSGQSVTQQCRSYVFTIDNQTKIRLIDTPGMGDTRGLDQDDLNMQHILSFINNLSHLNALCILLKPNEARLNVVLRSYFTRLVGFLGEHVRNNVIFCFTSTRTTFFAPGNTGPLLKKMLRSQPIKDIPFGKKNTFCFDNESFRYLIALLQGIKFDDYQKEEYLRSWVTSVNESNRLLDYMYDKLKPYPQNKWQSIEHAQFQITLLIRPMLETLRNLFRNVILQKHQPSQLPIELFPTPLSEPSTICLKCQFATQCCSNFSVVPDKLHIVSDKCKNCECSRRHHINVEYKLDYRNADIPNKEYWEKVKSDSDQLKKMILELTYFFTSIVPHSENDDPITKVLTQMIVEENRICSSENMKYLNPKLSDRLRRFNEEYKQKRNDSISNGNSIDLSAIYQLIEKISDMDSIEKQIDVIKEFRQEYMKNQEKEIHNDIRSKRY